jgi:hypothetical protein
MKNEILIAIISGSVTLITSLILAAYRTRLEVKKALRQLEESYTKSLYELGRDLSISAGVGQVSSSRNRRI